MLHVPIEFILISINRKVHLDPDKRLLYYEL